MSDDRQTLVPTGIEDAVGVARNAAGDVPAPGVTHLHYEVLR
jgi:hypothetical protein